MIKRSSAGDARTDSAHTEVKKIAVYFSDMDLRDQSFLGRLKGVSECVCS